MTLEDYFDENADLFFEALLNYKDERDKRKGGAAQFTNPVSRPVTDGDGTVQRDTPFDPITGKCRWVNAGMLRNMTADERAKYVAPGVDLGGIDADRRYYPPDFLLR